MPFKKVPLVLRSATYTEPLEGSKERTQCCLERAASWMTTSFFESFPMVSTFSFWLNLFSAGKSLFTVIGDSRHNTDSTFGCRRMSLRTLSWLAPQWQCISTRAKQRLPRLHALAEPTSLTLASCVFHSTSAPHSEASSCLWSGVMRFSTSFLLTDTSTDCCTSSAMREELTAGAGASLRARSPFMPLRAASALARAAATCAAICCVVTWLNPWPKPSLNLFASPPDGLASRFTNDIADSRHARAHAALCRLGERA
mmetsp:Transcript_91227/g.261084  ORF Transcript_91227/g.261084 Transcript_91227/m.261084 type:complete len:256 (+) Transcript_91227:393-1160(+)